jgi:hypothetical protein
VIVDGREIVLRDQKPLHKGNTGLPNGYKFDDFIESLNRRVFFWPGDKSGPIDYGLRHFERYKDERPVVLRIDFASLIDANPSIEPRFCRYNSGAPRCSYGKKSPRGPRTFLAAAHFEGAPAGVVELTFEGEISLPPNTKFGKHPAGPWSSLF